MWFLWQIKLKKKKFKQVQGNTVFLELNYFSAYALFYYVQTEIKMWKSLDLVLYKLVTAQLAQMASSLGRQSHPRGFVGRKSLGKVIHHVWQDDCDI